MRCVLLASTILLSGCNPFLLAEINTGVGVGRTFEDGRVMDSGKTAWNVNISGKWINRR